MTPDEMRAWRAGLGLTQLDAASLLAVTKRTVSMWETGAHPIPLMVLYATRWISSEVERG